jgi:hypothetical protein
MLTSLVVAAVLAADPCEAPRVRDTAPLVAAMAQDKVLGLAFTKAAGVCAERGEACDQARLECTTLLNQTIQKQVGFDEGQWLRDMLLPFNGAAYPMSRQFGAAGLASDASCNVEIAQLEQAAQRRQAQAARRDAIYQEYQAYKTWSQTQLQKCRERASADEVKNAQAKAESERLAAAAAAIAAADALKAKQAQEAAAARAEAEKKAKDAADAEARKEREAKEAAEREARERKDAEQRARDEREKEKKEALAREEKQEEARKKEREDAEAQRQKEKEEAEKKAEREKEEEERKVKDAEEKRLVTERDTRITQQRQAKARLLTEAEDNLKAAKDNEALKKQLALDAVSSSPAIAAAAVAEAAAAEKARVDAEKRLVEAKQKADAIIIDDSHERSTGSVFITGGGFGTSAGFGLAVLGGAHFGFWGTAPPDGMASGLELRLWARYLATLGTTPTQNFDSLLSLRYFFGRVAVGVAGELRLLEPSLSTLRGGAGASVGVAFVDTRETRVVLGINYMPLGNVLDPVRFVGDLEISWRFLTFQVHGGSYSTGASTIGWQVGGTVGLRASW